MKFKLLILVKHIEGGTGTFVTQLLNLQKINLNLTISVVVLGKQKYRMFQNKKVHVRYFNAINNYPEYYQFTFAIALLVLKELLWLRKEIKAIKPDIILSIDTHCNLLASVMKYCFFRQIKLIISTHNNISAVTQKKLSSFLCFFLKKIGKFFFKKADCLVCISKGVVNDFRSFFSINKSINIIPYGLDIKQSIALGNKNLPNSNQILFDNKYKKIVSIGRFEIQKDFETLIKAFALVYRKGPNTRLYLIGDGYAKEKLIDLTKQLNINNAVYFLGWKQNVYPYLKSSDIFVLSSKYEGFGWVLLEAMSQGLPIISTNAPYGPSEVLGNGKYGIFVPVGNEKKVAEAMIKLLTDKKLYDHYRKMALERIKFYTEEKMLRAYKKLILNLMRI